MTGEEQAALKQVMKSCFKAGYKRGTQNPVDWDGDHFDEEFEQWYVHTEKLIALIDVPS